GAFLREARLAQSLAVADVARQLKLSTNQVEALEAGEFARLPGPVFVRGFVRNYARLLRLEVEPLVEAVAAKLAREDPLPAPPSVEVPSPTTAPRRWGAYAAVVGLVVAALATYEFFPTAPEPAATESTAAAPAAAPALSLQPDSANAAVPDAAAAPSPGASSDRAEAARAARTGTDESARPVQSGPQAMTGAGEGTQGANQPASSAPRALEAA